MDVSWSVKKRVCCKTHPLTVGLFKTRNLAHSSSRARASRAEPTRPHTKYNAAAERGSRRRGRPAWRGARW
eukprot:2559670-Prymnesium_polylepis.3